MVLWTQGPGDHVSEREPGRWEDCVFASGVEFTRAGLNDHAQPPATNAEREALRAAAGLPEDHHGATLAQLAAAIGDRYGITGGWRIVRDWPTIEAHVTRAGTVAVVTGSMGAIPAYWRRWDPGFTGAHATLLLGRAATAPIWCDPLAPQGTYKGEPMPVAVLHDYVTGYAGSGALLAEIGGLRKEDSVAVYIRENKTGTFVVPAGYTVNRRRLTDTGFVKAGSYGPLPTPTTFHFEAVLTRTITDPVDAALTKMLLGSDGYFDGYYVSPTVVVETYDPPPADTTPYDQADLDAATDAGKTAGRATGLDEAEAAVHAIPR